MSGAFHGSVRVVKLLLICAGTIALQNEARSSHGLGAMDAGTNVQEPADRPLQAPPNVHEYPATDYIEALVTREYEIAQLWITQVDPQAPDDKRLPWVARLDGRLPPFATRKFAVQALEHVRHNDPTGPLADDAAIKIADYYMKRHEFDTAAQYYAQIVVEYPKSPLCAYARRAAFNARIRSYLEL